MSYIVTLDGKTVLADAPITWRRTQGTRPSTMTLRLPKVFADDIMSRAGRATPLTLSITKPSGSAEEITNLYAIARAPTEAPAIGAIIVADRRWWYAYKRVLRRYNLRRKTGYERVTTVDASGNYAVEPVVPEFAFKRFSTNNGDPVTIREMIVDTFGEIDDPDALVFDPSFDAVPQPAIDEVDILADGSSALDQLLAFMPELTCTVDEAGKFVIYSRAAGLDVDQTTVTAIGPTIQGSSHVVVQDLSPVTPSHYDVYFPIECEVRFDGQEGGSTAAVDPFEEVRTIRNVIAVPDYEIEVDGSNEVQGSWVDYERYVEAVAADPPTSGAVIDLEMIRTAMVPGVGLWEALGLWGDLDYDANWQARIAALAGCYRTAYRIPRGWIDRVLSIRASRVATVSQATGQRGAALLYSDHAIVASTKTQIRNEQQSGAGAIRFATNVDGYTETISPSTRPAPAVVSVTDEDLGVLNFAYQSDPWGRSVVVLPGQVEALGVPALRRAGSQGDRPLTYNAITSGANSFPQLDDEHYVAVILTMMPGAPNSLSQYYRVRVTPDEVSDLLHPAAVSVATNARGPGMDVVIRQETARIRWSDPDADLIEKLFLGPALDDTDYDRLSTLVTNDSRSRGQLGATRGASLNTIARAVAARGWASYAMHLAGSTTGGRGTFTNPPLRGYAQSISTSLQESGALLSTVAFAERLPEFDWTTLLDAGSRAILLKQVPR